MFNLIEKAQRYNCSDKLIQLLEHIIEREGDDKISLTIRLNIDNESRTIEYSNGYIIETIYNNGMYHFNTQTKKHSVYGCQNYESLNIQYLIDNQLYEDETSVEVEPIKTKLNYESRVVSRNTDLETFIVDLNTVVRNTEDLPLIDTESKPEKLLQYTRSLNSGWDYKMGIDYVQNTQQSFSFTNSNSDLVLGVNNTGKVLFRMTPQGKIILSNTSKLEMLEGLYNLGVLSKEAVTCELKIELLKNDSSVAYNYNNSMTEEERVDCIYYGRDIHALISKINRD